MEWALTWSDPIIFLDLVVGMSDVSFSHTMCLGVSEGWKS